MELCESSHLDTLRELAEEFATARRVEVQENVEVELLRAAISEMDGHDGPVRTMRLQDFVNNANGHRDTGEKPLTSRGVSSTLRMTLRLRVDTGTGNYSYVTLHRDHLSALATRYGLQPPSEEVKKGTSGSANANSHRPAPKPRVRKRSRPT